MVLFYMCLVRTTLTVKDGVCVNSWHVVLETICILYVHTGGILAGFVESMLLGPVDLYECILK